MIFISLELSVIGYFKIFRDSVHLLKLQHKTQRYHKLSVGPGLLQVGMRPCHSPVRRQLLAWCSGVASAGESTQREFWRSVCGTRAVYSGSPELVSHCC